MAQSVHNLRSAGQRALLSAAQNGHAVVIDALLGDARVDPTVDLNAALRFAAAMWLPLLDCWLNHALTLPRRTQKPLFVQQKLDMLG